MGVVAKSRWRSSGALTNPGRPTSSVAQGQPEARLAQRILYNMEMWRWMPEDLGKLHRPSALGRAAAGLDPVLWPRLAGSWPGVTFTGAPLIAAPPAEWTGPSGAPRWSEAWQSLSVETHENA